MKRRDRRQKKFLNRQQEVKPVVVTDEEITKEKETNNSIYYKHYKILLIIPFIMLLAALIVIGVQISQTGDFINKGMSFTGGTEITITKPGLDILELESKLKIDFPDNQIAVRQTEQEGVASGATVEVDITQEESNKVTEFTNKVREHANIQSNDEITENSIAESMGKSFFNQLMVGIIIALAFMGIVVFLYFKTIVPSTAVILAAVSDIIVTIAVADLMGMTIGVAGITALLMLIGYSVDTDILLSSRVLKNTEGTVYSRVINSMKTGMTMTLTTMVAVIVTLIVVSSANITELMEIMTIVLIGLVIDVINTWIQNAGIIRWYMEKKDVKRFKNE